MQTFVDLWRGNFNTVVRTANFLRRKTFRTKYFSEGSICVELLSNFRQIRLIWLVENANSMSPIVWKVLSQLQITCPKEGFEEKHAIGKFLILNIFGLLGKKFWQVFQNCVQRAQ